MYHLLHAHILRVKLQVCKRNHDKISENNDEVKVDPYFDVDPKGSLSNFQQHHLDPQHFCLSEEGTNRQMKKASLGPGTLADLYWCTIKSILTNCISQWCTDQNTLQQVIKSAQHHQIPAPHHRCPLSADMPAEGKIIIKDTYPQPQTIFHSSLQKNHFHLHTLTAVLLLLHLYCCTFISRTQDQSLYFII